MLFYKNYRLSFLINDVQHFKILPGSTCSIPKGKLRLDFEKISRDCGNIEKNLPILVHCIGFVIVSSYEFSLLLVIWWTFWRKISENEKYIHSEGVDILSRVCTSHGTHHFAFTWWLLRGQTSYRKISWSIEATRFGFRLFQPLWNLTGTSAAAGRDACQISERYDHFDKQSSGFEILLDLAVRHLTA